VRPAVPSMHRPAPRTLKSPSSFLIHYSFRTVMARSSNSCAYLIGAHPDWAASLPCYLLFQPIVNHISAPPCAWRLGQALTGPSLIITWPEKKPMWQIPRARHTFLASSIIAILVTCQDNREPESTAKICFFTAEVWQNDCKHFCTIMFASEAVLDTSKADKTSK